MSKTFAEHLLCTTCCVHNRGGSVTVQQQFYHYGKFPEAAGKKDFFNKTL